MTPAQKKVLGSIFAVAATSAVALLAPAYREAAMACLGVVLGALHIQRPGDVKAGE